MLTDMHAWQDYIGKSMALHTRYPGHDGHQPVPNSPLGRVKDIVDAFFATCNHTACVPEDAMPLLAYWRADSNTKPYPPPKNPLGSSLPKFVSVPHSCTEEALVLCARPIISEPISGRRSVCTDLKSRSWPINVTGVAVLRRML